MALNCSYARIAGRLARRRGQANNILLDNAGLHLKPWELRFLSESLIFNIWLDWNNFVKEIFVASCEGTITRQGTVVPPRPVADNSAERICYEVKQYASGCQPKLGKTYVGPLDPTWANPDKIIACITGLAPANVSSLQQAFGTGNLVGHKRIHLVRNACAHKSRVNRTNVKALMTAYATTHFLDPIDVIWGSNASTNTIAIFEWISDLETMADIATA